MIDQCTFENLGPFRHIEWDCPDLGVLVGSHGAGKTTFLRLLYATLDAYSDFQSGRLALSWNDSLAQAFRQAFRIPDVPRGLETLISTWAEQGSGELSTKSDRFRFGLRHSCIRSDTPPREGDDIRLYMVTSDPMFDSMGPQPQTAANRRSLSKQIHQAWSENEAATPEWAPPLLDRLRSIMGGTVVQDQGVFCYQPETQDDTILPLSQVSDSVCRLVALMGLIRSGQLKPGSVLLWDDLGARLSTRAIKHVCEVLTTLASNRVQVIVSTRQYHPLKRFELAARQQDEEASYSTGLLQLRPTSDPDQGVEAGHRDLSHGIPTGVPVIDESLELLEDEVRVTLD